MTTPDPIRAHLAAAAEKLRENSVLQSCTFDDDVTGNPQRYVLVGVSRDHFSDRLTAPDASALYRISTRSIGLDKHGCLAIQEQVFAQLWNSVLAIPTRQTGAIRHAGGQEALRDPSDDVVAWFATDFFEFTSDPA